MQEELNSDVEVGRVLWVTENFFKQHDVTFHEIAFYRLMKFDESNDILTNKDIIVGWEGSYEMFYKWHRIDELDNILLYPEFLKKSLKSLPDSVEHLIIGNMF